jgi:hypothetical protein
MRILWIITALLFCAVISYGPGRLLTQLVIGQQPEDSLTARHRDEPPAVRVEAFQNLTSTWSSTLDAAQAVYGEDDLIPVRIRLSGLTVGRPVDMTLTTTDGFAGIPVEASNGRAVLPCDGIACPATVKTAPALAVQIYGAAGTPSLVAHNPVDNRVRRTLRLRFIAASPLSAVLLSVHTSTAAPQLFVSLPGQPVKSLQVNDAVGTSRTPLALTAAARTASSAVDQPAGITATLLGKHGFAGRTVAFWESAQANCESINSGNATLLGLAALNVSGQATLNHAWKTAGPKRIWVCYGGDDRNLARGTLYTHHVEARAAAVTINPAAGPYGGKNTSLLAATLSADGASVQGKTIDFYVNGAAVGSAVTNSSGVAILGGDPSLAGMPAGKFGAAAVRDDCKTAAGVCAAFAGDGTLSAAAGSNQLTITRVPLTVVAQSQVKDYDGSVYAPFTYVLTGFVAGESAEALRRSGSLRGDAVMAGPAATATAAGSHAITPLPGTLSADNYEVAAFVGGMLTITAPGKR